MLWRKKVPLILVLLPLLLLWPLTVTYSQLQSVRTVLNDVWDFANHRLMTTADVRAQGSFQSEVTIFNDVWDSSGHFLRVSGPSGLGALTGIPVGDGAGAYAAYLGTSCTNQFVRSVNASGVATCASVAHTDVAAMTSAQLAGIVSNESGGGLAVFNDTPTLLTPIVGGAAVADGRLASTTTAGTASIGQTTSFFDLYSTANLPLRVAVNSVVQMTIDPVAGAVALTNLKTTGAATGKTVVCVDVVTGVLYASTSGVACAN